MIPDVRDIVASILRIRGALLDFGIAIVVAQMIASAAYVFLRRPSLLREWLVPAYVLTAFGGRPALASPWRAATDVAGLPSLLPTLVLGGPFVIGRVIAGLALALITRAVYGSSFSKSEVRPGIGPGDGLVALLTDVAGPFAVSAVAGGILTILIPHLVTAAMFGPGSVVGPLLGALLGFPIRAIAGAELPLAAALLVAGGSPGTVVALITGSPVLNWWRLRSMGSGGTRQVALYAFASWALASGSGSAVDALIALGLPAIPGA